ncbi:MAG: flagellar assembly protein FliH [Gammaproteobacteria bacterium]|nr:flagellar assembly protein FliH [Gammaproteobacteria bacterium]
MSKVVYPDQSTDYERWELPEVDDPAASHYSRLLTAGQIENIQKQAYEEGFKQGRDEGYAAGQTLVNQHATRLKSMLDLLSAPLAELDEQVMQQLLDLVTTIARQVIRRELRADPGQVIGVVRECIKALPIAARKVIIYLHPEDAELVRNAFSIDEGTDQAWKIVEDPVLTRGGCRIEAEHSKIDASVEQQLNRVIANLLGGERERDNG